MFHGNGLGGIEYFRSVGDPCYPDFKFSCKIFRFMGIDKVNVLGVSPYTIEEYGAVSSETAIEMAEGARKACGCGLGLSITGVAGPGGGTEEKPAGTVFIALADRNGTKVRKLNLWGTRERIRHSSCLYALDMIRRHELGTEDED